MKFTRRALIVTAALTLAGAGYGLQSLVTDQPLSLANPALAQDLSDLAQEGALKDMVTGEANAPVTIIEYASMSCPHCKDFHETVLPSLKEKYISTGKVKLVFREFPLEPRAFAASMLARCADEKFYFPMVDVLFQQQENWSRAADPRPPLLQIARLAGFTQESFEACLQNQELLDKINAVRTKASESYGVNGTPAFFINGKRYEGQYTVEAFSATIDGLL